MQRTNNIDKLFGILCLDELLEIRWSPGLATEILVIFCLLFWYRGHRAYKLGLKQQNSIRGWEGIWNRETVIRSQRKAYDLGEEGLDLARWNPRNITIARDSQLQKNLALWIGNIVIENVRSGVK